MGEKKKNYNWLIALIIFAIIGTTLYFFVFNKQETESQKEARELAEKARKSGEELREFNNKVEQEAQEKLDLLEKGYDVPTKSYFSSPENIKLQYALKEKGYEFETTTIKSENSTYFQNEEYFILGKIDITTNKIIDICFRNKSLKSYACSILNVENIDTEEKQEQYNSYEQWLKDNNLTLEQLKSVLMDYYLDNK